MIKDITHIELDLKKFPYEISSWEKKILIKKWTFTNEVDAKEALNSIWNEVLREKKNGTS